MPETAKPEIVIEWLDGNCPVQAEGTVSGKRFYFKSRGARWSLSVGDDPLGNPEFYYEEPYGKQFEAGWITENEARSFIDRAAGLFAESKIPAGQRNGL